MRVIASVEDPLVIGTILAQLEQAGQATGSPADFTPAHRPCGPPGQGLLELS